MKKIAILIALVLVFGVTTKSEAQLLKGFGKKIEKKIEDRIERKADRNVDKVLDKADREIDKPIDDVLNKPANKSDTKEASKKDTNESKPLSENTQTQSTAVNTQAVSEGLVLMSGSNCTDFIWFKTGAMMEFETKDGKGKLLNKSKMDISKVYNDGAVTIADVRASDGEGNEFDMQFKCAGDKLYMDFGSLINQAMQKAGQSNADNASIQRALDNTEIGFSDGFMEFPKSMYPGQLLEDVSVTIKTSPTPQISMEIFSDLTGRKVLAKEKVVTAAGSFDCLKISGTRNMSMKVMGMNKKMDSSTEYIWFAPGIGVIKQEDYDAKGKLGSSTQLTAYKL